MRTTLTLEKDVAAEIEALRRKRDLSLKDVVNEALRRGLRDMRRPAKNGKPFRTEPIPGVAPLLSNVDNVAEIIALLEGELHK